MGAPNLLLLHTDQQRADTIAALGNPTIHTPNLDRLVAEGTAFTNARSSCPICVPARHDLLTGQTARHHGYWAHREDAMADPALPTFPRLLAEAGYQTWAVGKMHYHPVREHHGFAHMELMEELPHAREDDAYLQFLAAQGYPQRRTPHGVRPLFYRSPQEWDLPEELHGTAWVANRTAELIRRRRRRPWMIFSSWIAPHPPLALPERWLNRYRGVELPPPLAAPGAPANVVPSPYRVDAAKERRMREAYYGAISMIDHYLGEVLEALVETGQQENTLVLFTSDHGEMLGDRNCWSKHIPYEGSSRIPLLAAGPGFERGATSATAVSTWDVTETILAAAGIGRDRPAEVPGRDLQGLAPTDEARIAITHYETGLKRYVVAVAGNQKYIYWYNGGREEWFDLQADPGELNNLVPSRGEAPMLQRLRQAVIGFEMERGWGEGCEAGALKTCGDEGPLPYETSLYLHWSSFQFPDWEPGSMDEAARAQFLAEMRDCMKQDGAHITCDPELRRQAVAYWQRRGGKAVDYESVFKAMDTVSGGEG